MIKYLMFVFISVILAALLFEQSSAGVFDQMTYQAVLEKDGERVPGPTDLIFKIYNASSGGTLKWQETRNDYSIQNGILNIILGEVNAMSDELDGTEQYWLEIWVEGVLLGPRVKLTAVPYSMNANKLDGQDASAFALSAHNHDAVYINDGAGEINAANDFNFTTSTFVTNLDADKLDGQNSSVFSQLGNSIESGEITNGTIVNDDISASANISASKINDGSGSGLDADLLDGQNSSVFSQLGNSIEGNEITNGTIQFTDIGQNGAASEQVMKWSGSAWYAANDATGGVTDHGALTGLSDDDHPQYLLVSRSTFISQFTGRLDIQQSDIQQLMAFRNSSGLRLGWIHNRTGNLQLCADDASLFISSDLDIECTNEAGTATRPIYASAFNVSSARAIKTDIKYLTERDCQQALADISSLRPATYQLKEATDGQTHLGLIAEEVPSQLVAPRGDAVDLYALVTSLVAGVKALEAEVELQSETIKELKAEVELQSKTIKELRGQ